MTLEEAKAVIDQENAKVEEEANQRCQAFAKELETLIEKYSVQIVPVVQIVGNQITQSLQISSKK